MSFDLAPEIETSVRAYAEREGITPDELLARTFPPLNPLLEEDRVLSLLHKWQKEEGTPLQPTVSSQSLFQKWAEEDARLTPAEIKAEEQFWTDYQRHHERVEI